MIIEAAVLRLPAVKASFFLDFYKFPDDRLLEFFGRMIDSKFAILVRVCKLGAAFVLIITVTSSMDRFLA